MYKLDKTAFKAHTATSASAEHAKYYKTLTWQKRAEIAHYLNSIAYNFDINNPPRLDRSAFNARRRDG